MRRAAAGAPSHIGCGTRPSRPVPVPVPFCPVPAEPCGAARAVLGQRWRRRWPAGGAGGRRGRGGGAGAGRALGGRGAAAVLWRLQLRPREETGQRLRLRLRLRAREEAPSAARQVRAAAGGAAPPPGRWDSAWGAPAGSAVAGVPARLCRRLAEARRSGRAVAADARGQRGCGPRPAPRGVAGALRAGSRGRPGLAGGGSGGGPSAGPRGRSAVQPRRRTGPAVCEPCVTRGVRAGACDRCV